MRKVDRTCFNLAIAFDNTSGWMRPECLRRTLSNLRFSSDFSTFALSNALSKDLILSAVKAFISTWSISNFSCSEDSKAADIVINEVLLGKSS